MSDRQSECTHSSIQTRIGPSSQAIREGLVLVALVAVGVGLRLFFRDLPNFAPVAAVALFAGYYFRSMLVAASVPLAVMAISDGFLGGYDAYMMMLVYGMLAFPVLLRTPIRRLFHFERPGWSGTIVPLTGLVGCSLLASVLFFLVTNFGVWLRFGSYEPTMAGLVSCYAAAIPFFRHTIAGDLAFSVVLFGSYAAVHVLSAARIPAEQAA